MLTFMYHLVNFGTDFWGFAKSLLALYVYTEGGRFPRSCGMGAALCVSHWMAVEEDHLAGSDEGAEGVPRSDTSNMQGRESDRYCAPR